MEREEKKLRFAEANSDSNLGPKIISSADKANSPAQVPRNSIAKGIFSGFKAKKANALPFGNVTFAILLVMAALLLGQSIEILRSEVLSKLSENINSQNPSTRSPIFLDSRVAYADACGGCGNQKSIAILTGLIAECVARYGDQDPQTAYVRLCLSQKLIDADFVKKAKPLWRSALPVLTKSRLSKSYPNGILENITPKQCTEKIQNLARYYSSQRDYQDAALLYEAALKLWDNAPGNGSQTNAWAELSEIYAFSKDYVDADKYMKMALDKTRSGGAVQYNVYRAERLCKFNRLLKRYDIARKYGDEAVSMARTGLCSNDHFYKQAFYQRSLVEKNHEQALDEDNDKGD